jgi:hypothetical protein
MELFSTSTDLVNLALTIGIIGISAAIVYFFISAAGFVREMRQTIDELNRQLETIGQITESVKNKLTYMFSYWSILEKLVNKVINLFQKKIVNKVKDQFNWSSASKRADQAEPSKADTKINRRKAKTTDKRSKK